MRVRSVLLTATLIGCVALPDEPAGLVDYQPLPEYGKWYGELQRCAGIDGPPLNTVRWRQLPDATRLTYADTTFLAYWQPPATITISGWYIRSRPVIQHELLHQLLHGDHQHRDPRWIECSVLL
jgi:hypothetical protein